jgi:hypothetical protein
MNNVMIGAIKSFSGYTIFSNVEQVYLKPVKEGKTFMTAKITKKTNFSSPRLKVGDTIKIKYRDLGIDYYLLPK